MGGSTCMGGRARRMDLWACPKAAENGISRPRRGDATGQAHRPEHWRQEGRQQRWQHRWQEGQGQRKRTKGRVLQLWRSTLPSRLPLGERSPSHQRGLELLAPSSVPRAQQANKAKGKGIGAVEGAEWNQAIWDQFPTLGAMGWGGFSGL